MQGGILRNQGLGLAWRRLTQRGRGPVACPGSRIPHLEEKWLQLPRGLQQYCPITLWLEARQHAFCSHICDLGGAPQWWLIPASLSRRGDGDSFTLMSGGNTSWQRGPELGLSAGTRGLPQWPGLSRSLMAGFCGLASCEREIYAEAMLLLMT